MNQTLPKHKSTGNEEEQPLSDKTRNGPKIGFECCKSNEGGRVNRIDRTTTRPQKDKAFAAFEVVVGPKTCTTI